MLKPRIHHLANANRCSLLDFQVTKDKCRLGRHRFVDLQWEVTCLEVLHVPMDPNSTTWVAPTLVRLSVATLVTWVLHNVVNVPIEVYLMNFLVTLMVNKRDLVSMFLICMESPMDLWEYHTVLEVFPMDLFPMLMDMEDLQVNKLTHHQSLCIWV